MQKIRAMLQIIRPELPISAGVCVLIGQVIALGKLPGLAAAAAGFLLGFFLSSSAMVFNDLFDLEVDRINTPERPLPSGRLTRSEAVVLGIAAGLAGLAAGWYFNPLAFGLSLAAWVLGFLYNWKLKASGLPGNLIVSSNVALTFILGGVSTGRTASPMLWLFALIAFVFDLAEEIAGDAMDMAGDRARGSRSIAILHGKQTALRVSSALFALMVALTFLPAAWGSPGLGYWVPILLVDALVVYFSARLLRSQTPREGRKAMRALYLGATVGLVAAFLVGRFI